jgi:hypothetical protein
VDVEVTEVDVEATEEASGVDEEVIEAVVGVAEDEVCEVEPKSSYKLIVYQECL